MSENEEKRDAELVRRELQGRLDRLEDKIWKARYEAFGVILFIGLVLSVGGWFGLNSIVLKHVKEVVTPERMKQLKTNLSKVDEAAIFAEEAKDSLITTLEEANNTRDELGRLLIQVPVGTIVPYYEVGDSIPRGWALCDGRRVDDKESPFHRRKLPDLRGRFLRGVEQGKTFRPEDEGGQDWTEAHDHPHTHSVAVSREVSDMLAERINRDPLGMYYMHAAPSVGGLGHTHKVTVGTNSESNANRHDNRPRYLAVNYIIRIK